MRAVWWGAALMLLAVTTALRTSQAEGASRTGRRLSASQATEFKSALDSSPTPEVSTFRPRSSRRREELPARDGQTRTRGRPQTRPETLETPQTTRFESRRPQRTRTRTLSETSTTTGKDNIIVANRSRSNIRRFTTTSAPEVSNIDESKIEIINSNLEELAKVTSVDEKRSNPNSQFRRRSSTVKTTETVEPVKLRGRFNAKPIARTLDSDVAGTTNSITISLKEPTTARNEDLRNSRKLRYKTRFSETDTNLTGEGLKAQNEVTDSSQTEKNTTSQINIESSTPKPEERNTGPSTESTTIKSTIATTTKIIRRPGTRSKINYKSSASSPKIQLSDEINDDDNYPESFKALIQAKNASTHTSSSPSESLSVRASQKVYKTYTVSSQSTNRANTPNKYTRLRSKLSTDKKEAVDEKITETPLNETAKPKVPEFRPRGTFVPRNRKSSTFSPSSTVTVPAYRNSEKPQYKFNRKFKTNASEIVIKPKKLEISSKKTLPRSSYYQRNNSDKKNETLGLKRTGYENSTTLSSARSVLPRTSFYSRLRNMKSESTSSTTALPVTAILGDNFDRKTEETEDMPLILSLLKSPTVESSSEKMQNLETNEPTDKKMFIIAVTSKESQENNALNELQDMDKENLATTLMDKLPSSVKYHANYKDFSTTVAPENNENIISTTVPTIRNIQTRKNGRNLVQSVHRNVSKQRENDVKQYSGTVSKSKDVSNNGISPDPEKSKTRFSSKYRAAYSDKPLYKPTVPTVTTSTAWLKFFVTDQLLTKSVQEPLWFQDDDLHDIRTESMPRRITESPIFHESSLELVEGEEIDVGSDMNAISFTKPRSKLSSEDLRLSESLVNPSHILNVEASHYSPSVTVSIFDALAEILTSTPRNRLSSTTEVTQKQNTKKDVIQTDNGVSNINVNRAGSIPSQNTLISTSVDNMNKHAKPEQSTDQSSPVVNNRLPFGKGVTSSLSTTGLLDFVNTLSPAPTTPPSTPVSARKPFAIRVLYSDTEPSTDRFSTSTQQASFVSSTDSTTVYNPVSDLLYSNNNLVSSQLTSMLTNNIKSIIQNLDESSKNKITLDMADLLKTLIPRAVDGQLTVDNDVDIIPSTTPYSLEDIIDTGNIDIGSRNDNTLNNNILQNVPIINNVNIISNNNLSTNSSSNVNSSTSSPTTASDINKQTAQGSSTVTTVRSQNPQTTTERFSATLYTDIVSFINNNTRSNEDTLDNASNIPLRVPFLTNFRGVDFNITQRVNSTNKNNTNVQSAPITLPTATLNENLEVNDPSQVSQFQLWVLSKKAKVLKMIEDIIKQHNDELATVQPFTEIMSQQNNIPLSDRLTKIINNMGFTTETTNSNNDIDVTSPVTTSNILLSTTPQISTVSGNNAGANTITSGLSTTTQTTLPSEQTTTDFSLRFGNVQSTTQSRSTPSDLTTSSTEQTTSVTTRTQEDGTTVSTVGPTSQSNTETSTTPTLLTTTMQTDIAANNSSRSQTTESTATTTTVSQSLNFFNNTGQPIIPKKDYVIFGILPNNTVVRKDPNDDVLENLTKSSPYIVYGVLPNNTVIRKFPNGTRVPRIMQKIDVLPISPWSLRNPYSPIHNNPAIVRPQFNPTRVSTNIATSADIPNNGTENRLTNDTVNNFQNMIPSSALNIKDSSSLGVTITNKPPAEISTASHVLSLRTTTMLPSIDEILLNSISSAAKEDMAIPSMMSSTSEPRILTLDIDPETKQIRTEKPGDGNGSAIFKFIPIDEITVAPQNTNVLKLASTKAPSTLGSSDTQTVSSTTVNGINTQASQMQTQIQFNDLTTTSMTSTEPGSTQSTPVTLSEPNLALTESPLSTTIRPITTLASTTINPTTAAQSTTTLQASTASTPSTQTTTVSPTTSLPTATPEEEKQYQRDAKLLQDLLLGNTITSAGTPPNLLSTITTTSMPTTTVVTSTQLNEEKLLQALLGSAGQNAIQTSLINGIRESQNSNSEKTTTARSLQDDIRQFEEDTKLLKALLQATGQNPSNFNIPTLPNFNTKTTNTPTSFPTTTKSIPKTTTTVPTSTVSINAFTTRRPTTTTQSIDEDIKKLQEDTKLLQALLQATGQNEINNLGVPTVSRVTSNVRIASNPLTTSVGSNPTTAANLRPVYTTRNTTPVPLFTFAQRDIFNTISTTTEDVKISTTFSPINQERRFTTTTATPGLTGRRAPASRITTTTGAPSTSTFSVEEDLAFLKNLKTVLKDNANNEDPEAALANRIIALAVERSLNEIQTAQPNSERGGKAIANSAINVIPTTTTTPRTTTTSSTSTTTQRPTTTERASTPSLEDDIKQFQEDTKLLQALIQATGQDPSKFNIPTLPPTISNTKVSLKQSNELLPLTVNTNKQTTTVTTKPPPRVFGAKIAVKDNLQSVQDDEKLLKTLVKLQDARETTSQKNKLALTGQTSDEALKLLLQNQKPKPTNMVSEATRAPMSLSTEFGKSNDALLAALLKEQGFGPTTASSSDEQLRLSALLNQVVVTPKARRTTTPAPPPPPQAPRRPILDGLAWLWQQWRETAPGPNPRPNRRPAPSASPSVASSAATSNRVNWFGSGPFVGNADDQPSSNRVPLDPPRAVTSEQTPGRGQLVSAAINVTRAFSQFLGAAIQGAAQTVQSVIRAGQRAASDVYVNGSGGPGGSG